MLSLPGGNLEFKLHQDITADLFPHDLIQLHEESLDVSFLFSHQGPSDGLGEQGPEVLVEFEVGSSGEESCEDGLLVLLGGVFEEELEDFGEVGVAHGVDDGNGGEYLLEDGLEGGARPY